MFSLRSSPSRRRLLAPDAGDPGVRAGQRALERRHLGVAAAVGRAPGPASLLDLHVDAEALLEGPPGRQRLGEQHAGVDRDDAGVGRGAPMQPALLSELSTTFSS